VREALRRAQQVHDERLSSVLPTLPGGLTLPGLFAGR
jgi:hypothetical protein